MSNGSVKNIASKNKNNTRAIYLLHYTLALLFVWTAIIAGILIYQLRYIHDVTKKMAISEARTNFNKDQAFRLWSASHGGVYVPVDENTSPNPYLTHVKERDIETPSGKKLTLMNPAYIIRQLNERFSEFYGMSGHLTSLKPLNPGNAPDEWEKVSLKAFEEGQEEVIEFTKINGISSLRFMRPLYVKEECLKCHAHQGYKVGDVRGGVSVTLPMATFLAKERQQFKLYFLSYGLLWILGIFGVIIGHKGLVKRIKERMQAEEALQESEGKLQTLVKVSPVGIFKTDTDGNCVYVSEQWCRITGITQDEAYKEGWGEGLFLEDKERVFAKWDQMVKESTPFKSEFRFKKPDGEITWVFGQAVAEMRDQEEIISYIGTITDITDRKKIEEERKNLWSQLIQSQKMDSIGRLTGGVAHDFNNFLSAIIGYSEIILEKLPEDIPEKKLAERIIYVGEKASALVNQLLAFSKKQILDMRVSNLNIIIGNMSDIIKSVVRSGINVELNIKTPVNNVMADEVQIEQILMNLAVNAAQAMDKSGDLIIETKNIKLDEEDVKKYRGLKAGRHVMLSVKDTGTGMSREVQDKIFEPFYSTKEKGTGLGLSTVFGVVQQHNGYIGVESELDKGTTFKILLPAVEAIIKEAVIKEAIVAPKRAETILLAEDDEVIRDLFVDIIRPLGHKVIEAGSGEQALQISDDTKEEIDLLLSDVIMDGMNGLQLYEAIKKKRPDIKVVFTSGFIETLAVVQKIKKRGMPFIKKPLSPSELVNTIKKELGG